MDKSTVENDQISDNSKYTVRGKSEPRDKEMSHSGNFGLERRASGLNEQSIKIETNNNKFVKTEGDVDDPNGNLEMNVDLDGLKTKYIEKGGSNIDQSGDNKDAETRKMRETVSSFAK